MRIFSLLLFLSVGCADSYGERVRGLQQDGIEFFCPCFAADGEFSSQAECESTLAQSSRDYVDCIIPVYDAASAADQTVLNCAVDAQENVNPCYFESTCDDDANLDRCSEMSALDCGEISGDITLTRINTCLEILAS